MNVFDSNYDRNEYERLCREFYVHVHFDWRQTKGDNQGLGMIYKYSTNAGYHPPGKGTVYDSRSFSFTKATTNDFMHIDYIAQDARVINAWTTLILDDPNGFTKK